MTISIPQPQDRLSLQECRDTLGADGVELSDSEVLKLREALYMLGGVLCNDFLRIATHKERA